jgi:hypothetical protein
MRHATTSAANPMIDDRLRRGVDASWTSDGRGGGRRGSLARVPTERTELTSLTGSVRLRKEVASSAHCHALRGAYLELVGWAVVSAIQRRHLGSEHRRPLTSHLRRQCHAHHRARGKSSPSPSMRQRQPTTTTCMASRKAQHLAMRNLQYGRRCPSVALRLDPRPD